MKTSALLVCCAVLLATAAGAQDEGKSPADQIKAYIYGTIDEPSREKAVAGMLAGQPGLARVAVDGAPALIWALDLTNIEGDLGRKGRALAGMLVANGADVNMTDSEGLPLILRYAMFAQQGPLTFLLSHGAKPNVKDAADGRSPLHLIALLPELNADAANTQSRLTAAGALLDAGGDINARDVRGDTPLHAAAFLGNARMVEFLLARGADSAAANGKGLTPAGAVRQRQDSEGASERDKAGLKPVLDLLTASGQTGAAPAAAPPDSSSSVAAEAGPSTGDARDGAGPAPASVAGSGALSEVIIDRKHAAYTLFIGVPAAGLTAAQEAQLAEAGDMIERVPWATFSADPGAYVSARTVRNDYPGIPLAKGVAELLRKNPQMPFGVTWNSGVAFTFNDYEHTRAAHQKFQEGGGSGGGPDSAADPVHPMNHFKPLLGW